MTVDLAGYTWFIVAVSLFLLCLAYLGYEHAKHPERNSPDMVPPLLFVVCLWPLAVVAAIVSLPFWAGYGVGKVSDVREAKRKRLRADEKEALKRLRASFDRSEPEWSILDEQIKSMA